MYVGYVTVLFKSKCHVLLLYFIQICVTFNIAYSTYHTVFLLCLLRIAGCYHYLVWNSV